MYTLNNELSKGPLHPRTCTNAHIPYGYNSLSLTFDVLHSGQNYVFALLTGSRDPPAGVSVILAL